MSTSLFVAFACLLMVGSLGCVSEPRRAAESSMVPSELRCDFRVDPLGIDSTQPRLSWALRAVDPATRGCRQTAYRLLVASTAERLASDVGDLWDSGTVQSDQSVLVPYGGRALASGQRVYWTVITTDESGHVSEPSAYATWTMGIVRDADWHARWIAADVTQAATRPLAPLREPTALLRRAFVVRPGLRRATAFVCGLGQYVMSVNGQRVGDDLLSPGWTDYRKTCLYDTRDLTPSLRAGENVVGLFLGGGMYDVRGGRYAKFRNSFGPLQAIAQIELEYDDGTRETVATDDAWQACAGPITFCDVFGGEDYDARLEQRGWNEPNFALPPTDVRWRAATITSGPGGTLRGTSSAALPIRAVDVRRPIEARPLSEGVVVYDFGQNAAVMPRLRVHGPAGSVVRMTPAEIVKADGSIDPGAVGSPCYWQYTLAGRASETWLPEFYYRGARYLQVECLGDAAGARATVDEIDVRIVQGDVPPAGTFACSNALFERIHPLVRWAQRSNLMSVLTDCPHREKLSWLEQYHLNGPALRYEWNLAALYAKSMTDMADAQLPSGLVPDIAPELVVFDGGFRDSPEWGSAFILAAWQQYQFHGDASLIQNHYDAMTRYADYLARKSHGDIVDHGLGDWYDIGPRPPGVAQLTPIALTATAIYYEDLTALARMADLLGKPDDSARYQQRAAAVRAAYIGRFRDVVTGRYASGSQTSCAMTLVLGLCEPSERATVLDALVKDIRDRGNAITGGDVGYRYILRALADGGRSDVIFDMNNQSEKPGYGYQLKTGATSLTEAWDGSHKASLNHFMLGQINEWFYHDLAGIQPDPNDAGFKRFVIRPALVGDLTWVRASYASDYGLIRSEWRRDLSSGSVRLEVSVPPNTRATVYMPARRDDVITESGRVLDTTTAGVRSVRRDEGVTTIEIGSGEYWFATTRE